MLPIVLITIQALVLIIGVPLYGVFVHRRTGAPARVWIWGALAFIASQVARTPLLIAATLGLAQLSLDWTETQSFWFNLVTLCASAALFEEGARWLVMRWRRADMLEWRDGVMFGAGHGGIEAIIYVALAAISNLVLLLLPTQLLLQGQTDPAATAAIQAQVDALRTMAWWMPFIALWERVLAITLHTAASLLVQRSILTHNALPWWGAFLLHFFGNAVVLYVVQYYGILAGEAALTVFALIPIAIIWQTWRTRSTESPTLNATPSQV